MALMLGHAAGFQLLAGFTGGIQLQKQKRFIYNQIVWPQISKRRQRWLCKVAESTPEASVEEVDIAAVDRFIDKIRGTDSQELPKFVAENIMSFDNNFWLRLATRSEQCTVEDDKADLDELASNVMHQVERVVKKTEEKIETSTDILLSIIAPVAGSTNEEVVWPPRDPEALQKVRKELVHREGGGYLDESFLSEVNAQLRQANEDGDKPGLMALLRKILQLYAATFLSKRSYAKKNGVVDKAEHLLETVIAAENEDWDGLIKSRITVGGGEVTPDELLKVTKKRVERILLRTDAASYKQRVLVPYVKEIQRFVEQYC